MRSLDCRREWEDSATSHVEIQKLMKEDEGNHGGDEGFGVEWMNLMKMKVRYGWNVFGNGKNVKEKREFRGFNVLECGRMN